MNRRRVLSGLLCLLLVLAAGLPVPAQALARFLDQPRPAGEGVRLVIFNPETYNLRALVALRNKGILKVPNLTVIGVYHVNQTNDFESAATFVQENGLDWIKFHAISAAISEPGLFKRNACRPDFELILKNSDGVIFFGGADIPPSIFHQQTNLLTQIEDPFRHYLELSAIFHLLGGAQDPAFTPLLAARPEFPVLGICLGFQSLNVGTGGVLVQDIWSEVYGTTKVEEAIALKPEQWHNNPYRRIFPLDKLMSYNFHTLQLAEQGTFTRTLGFQRSDHPRVLSSHHQGVTTLAKGWSALATSRDGKIIEAMEHTHFPNVLGVQFHPEHPMLWDTEPRYRQQPGEPLTSYHAILSGTPRSLEFNRAIWTWLGDKLQASRAR